MITIDAMGCQRSFAEQIVAGGGDYVLAVKGNQGALLGRRGRHLCPRTPRYGGRYRGTSDHRQGTWSVGNAHLCGDCRSSEIARLNPAQQWPGLQSIIRITATRASASAPLAVPTTSTRYHISSLLPDAVRLNQVIRSHWAIENEVHWVLDMIYREDSSRVRRGYAQQNLAVIRKLDAHPLEIHTQSQETKPPHSAQTRGLEHGYPLRHARSHLNAIALEDDTVILSGHAAN
ncbi:MAG: ISAs1 family transposase [Thermomicrobiales bacterium]|nr:ISAs1 family transposase [Thermomicrobiales bacterium]